MRCLGLIDPSSSVYGSWRMPDPTAPYPQDYVIDQLGQVAYWNDQYDPQAVMAVIDRLLGSGVEEHPRSGTGQMPSGALMVRGCLMLATGWVTAQYSLLAADGRRVLVLRPGANDVSRLAPGVYFIGGRWPGGGDRWPVAGGRVEVGKVVIQR